MSKKPVIAKQIGIISVAGNRVEVKWIPGTSQAAKVDILRSLSYAEHEILIRHKYYHQSDIIDPHTGKNIMIEKEGIKPD